MDLTLISVPLRRLRGYRPFWTIFLLTLITEFLLLLVLSNISTLTLQQTELPMLKFSFPHIWLNLSWIGRVVNYFMGFLLIQLVSADHEDLTLRQNMINGWSREDCLLSYHLLCLMLALVSLLMLLGFGFSFGHRMPGQAIMDLSHLRLLSCYLLQSFLLFQFALMVSLLVRRAVPSVFCFLGWLLILEPLLGSVVDAQIRKGYSEFLPFHSIGKLLPDISPEALLTGSIPQISGNYILMSLFYLLLMALISWLMLRFRDL